MESKQHTQLPNEMDNLEPKDQLIYLAIKSFLNSETGECFPSLQTIATKINASIPTVRSSIKRLEECGYIKVTKKGRKQYYSFNEYKTFEPFSPEFIDNDKITFTTKAYLAASQQYMFKDVEGYGKISYPNRELSKLINMPESTIRKCNNELVNKNYLEIVKNESRDLETGCKTDSKIFQLNKLGQAVIWAIQNHEERITQNTEDIRLLKEEIQRLKERDAKKDELIQRLLEKETISYTI